jgi:hypothetical protein
LLLGWRGAIHDTLDPFGLFDHIQVILKGKKDIIALSEAVCNENDREFRILSEVLIH